MVSTDGVPQQQTENGHAGRQEEGEEGGRKRQEQAGKQAKSLQRESQDRPATVLGVCGVHRVPASLV
jgi:hypothetical protein